MLLALAPPHPHSQALNKTIPVSAVDLAHMAELHPEEVDAPFSRTPSSLSS